MKVLLAEHAGACYGVQRALDMAHEAAEGSDSVHTLGPLIHNPQVVRELEAKGVRVAAEPEDIEEGIAIIRSHGGRPRAIEAGEVHIDIAGTAPLRALRRLLVPGGAVVLVAGVTGLQVSNVSIITSRQLSIIGSWTFSNVGQAECTRFVADKNIPVDDLFTHQWKLGQAEEAYELFAKQSDGKGVFVF